MKGVPRLLRGGGGHLRLYTNRRHAPTTLCGCSVLKTWVLVAVGVVVAAMVGAATGQGVDETSPVCSSCECLLTMPFEVDCSHTAMEKVPDLSKDAFSMPAALDLSYNMIHRVTKFDNVPRVVTVLLKMNQISSIEDEAFSELSDLRRLSLRGNNLTQAALTENVLKGKSNNTHKFPLSLEELDLSYNQLHSLDNHAFKHLPYLRRLFLSNNPIRDISRGMASAISELSNLEELDLSQTGIERLPDHFLSGFMNLQVLTLAGNRFTSVPSELRFARSLQELNLNANLITTISAEDFPDNLWTLRKLELSALPNLRSVGQQAFSCLSGLRSLLLSNNPSLAIINKEAFLVLPGNDLLLEEIHLQDNHLTTLEEGMLPWLDLSLVDLQNNPWNCDCHLEWMAETLIPDLEQKNPQTTISLMCASPAADRGMRIVDLVGHAHAFECVAPQPFSRHEGRYGTLIVGTIVVGTILLITGTLAFVFVLYRRNREHQLFGERVKYRRAQNEEEDGVTHTVNS